MRTHVALLRAINVGGYNLISMSELKNRLLEAGFEDVKTILQSGNVVFRASAKMSVQHGLTASMEGSGVRPEFYVRTRNEWHAIIESNPFQEHSVRDPGHLLVFVGTEPMGEWHRPDYDGPEQFGFVDGHLFVYYPEGIGSSKLGRNSSFRRATRALTGRNWNTVLRIMRALDEVEPKR